MTPYFQDEHVTIYHGDCWDLLPNLPHVDLVLTDPPYGIPEAAWRRTYHGSRGRSPLWGSVPSWDKVPERIKDIVELADNVVLWGGNNFDLPAAPHWFVWDKLQSNRGADCEMAWTKGTAAHKVFRMSRIDAYVNKACGLKKEHPTQKPLALMVWCIEQMGLCTGSMVFDPFMGAGTSLLAARKTGHKAIGVELEERYCEIAARRMAQGVLDFGTANAAGQGRREATYHEPACSALDYEEPDDREERCDSCGETGRCLMRGLCPMCYELNGGTHD